MHHNRCPPVLACKSFWRYRRVSERMPSGMRSMSLKSSSLQPIARRLRSKTRGETALYPPPFILSPAAARRVDSRSRNFTRGDPSRICRDAWHVDSATPPPAKTVVVLPTFPQGITSVELVARQQAGCAMGSRLVPDSRDPVQRGHRIRLPGSPATAQSYLSLLSANNVFTKRQSAMTARKC